MNNQKNQNTGSAVTTLLGAIVIVIAFVFLLVRLATSGYFADVEEMTGPAVETRIKPQGVVTMGDGVPAGQRTGESVFNKVCIQCHAENAVVANSPKMNHPSDWAPRIAKGMPALLHSAINGFNAMPKRGGNPDLTNDELERAIVYMANSAGGKFTEPAIVAASDATSASAPATASAASAAQ